MGQTAPPSDRTDNRAVHSQLVPPDESFWQRYSPHAEFPLSSAGSLAIHLLVFGLLGLAAVLSAVLFTHGSRSLPVEAVRLDLGGGGGNPHGRGDGPNNGPAPVEAGEPQKNEATENAPAEDVPPLKINVDPGPRLKPQFDAESTRFLQQTPTDSARSFQRLSDVTARIRVPDAKPSSGFGRGGTGSGGGSGSGKGKGVGNSSGEGRGALTQREKRMLRWSMLFNTKSGPDYVAQLHGLDAILAIPVHEDATSRDYRIVRDLSARPVRLLNEDITRIQRIYWIDDKEQSVRDVLIVLGIQLPMVPSHFVAFMPEELEQKLYRLEKAYLEKHYRGRTEDNIVETKFRIRVHDGKYEPEVIGLKVKVK